MSAQDMAASLRTELTGRPLVRLPYFSVHGNMHHAPQGSRKGLRGAGLRGARAERRGAEIRLSALSPDRISLSAGQDLQGGRGQAAAAAPPVRLGARGRLPPRLASRSPAAAA